MTGEHLSDGPPHSRLRHLADPRRAPGLGRARRARAGADAELHVIAPAANVSRLQWLTDDIDGARVEAGERAEAIADRAETDNAEPHIGDTDPLQAIEDGLRLFPADEIIVITHGDEQATWLEAGSGEAAIKRFAVPVTHLSADEVFAPAPPDDTAQNGSPVADSGRAAKSAGDAVAHPVETTKDLALEAQHGQSPRTPLLAFTGVTNRDRRRGDCHPGGGLARLLPVEEGRSQRIQGDRMTDPKLAVRLLVDPFSPCHC